MVVKNISSFPCSGLVWKVLWDTTDHMILVESRKAEERKVYFKAIPLSSDTKISELEINDWSLGMVGAIGGKVILQGQGKSSLPEPLNLYCYDLYKGSLLWIVPGHSFLGVSEDYVYSEVLQDGELIPFQINIKTGVPGKTTGLSSFESTKITFPALYLEGESYFDQVKDFLSEKGRKPSKAIEYWEGSTAIAVSFYEEIDNKLQNIIMIFDHSGTNERYYLINSDGKGISDGTFFIVKESLVFVRDKKEIVILYLNS